MNWKLFSVIWNITSLIFWATALCFLTSLASFYFNLIQLSTAHEFFNIFKIITLLFFILMILFNIVTSFFSVKAENQTAMLWLIGLTYAQFLLAIIYVIILGLLYFSTYFI